MEPFLASKLPFKSWNEKDRQLLTTKSCKVLIVSNNDLDDKSYIVQLGWQTERVFTRVSHSSHNANPHDLSSYAYWVPNSSTSPTITNMWIAFCTPGTEAVVGRREVLVADHLHISQSSVGVVIIAVKEISKSKRDYSTYDPTTSGLKRSVRFQLTHYPSTLHDLLAGGIPPLAQPH